MQYLVSNQMCFPLWGHYNFSITNHKMKQCTSSVLLSLLGTSREKWQVVYLLLVCFHCTSFMIPAAIMTPQISLREKCSSLDLLVSQAIASSNSTPGLFSLDTTLAMLVLHWGSLYREVMVLREKEMHNKIFIHLRLTLTQMLKNEAVLSFLTVWIYHYYYNATFKCISYILYTTYTTTPKQ